MQLLLIPGTLLQDFCYFVGIIDKRKSFFCVKAIRTLLIKPSLLSFMEILPTFYFFLVLLKLEINEKYS